MERFSTTAQLEPLAHNGQLTANPAEQENPFAAFFDEPNPDLIPSPYLDRAKTPEEKNRLVKLAKKIGEFAVKVAYKVQAFGEKLAARIEKLSMAIGTKVVTNEVELDLKSVDESTAGTIGNTEEEAPQQVIDISPQTYNVPKNNYASVQLAFEALDAHVEPEAKSTEEDHIETKEVALITDAVEAMEHGRGFVEEAPDIDEQAADESRTNTLKYLPGNTAAWGKDSVYGAAGPVEITEHDAINGLLDFLNKFVAEMSSRALHDPGVRRQVEIAQGMLENLTYIGEKEYKIAAEALGMLWKSFLDADPKNQLCVLTKISETQGIVKSDAVLFDSILSTFTDEEIDAYGDRILTDLSQLDSSTPPENVRIVLLDDWTVSGSQMQNAFDSIQADPEFSKYADCIEANFITASAGRLEEGLELSGGVDKHGLHLGDKKLKVRAYYRSHDASNTSYKKHKGHVTGSHSSVDYDFEQELSYMVSLRRNLLNDDSKMPPASNIIRQYRNYVARHRRVGSGKSGRIERIT